MRHLSVALLCAGLVAGCASAGARPIQSPAPRAASADPPVFQDTRVRVEDLAKIIASVFPERGVSR